MLSVITLLADGDAELNLRAKGLLLRRAGESKTGNLPENAFHRVENLQAFDPQAVHAELFWGPTHTRIGSPSAHPRPASGGATDFFLASALSDHQQALRPPGGEDARCVQPISATQSNCVHPHLARSRLALATFAARTPHGD
jgi:hypothetical protein